MTKKRTSDKLAEIECVRGRHGVAVGYWYYAAVEFDNNPLTCDLHKYFDIPKECDKKLWLVARKRQHAQGYALFKKTRRDALAGEVKDVVILCNSRGRRIDITPRLASWLEKAHAAGAVCITCEYEA